MAMDVKAIACPQCGSNDVEMTSDTRGVCQYCGTQFIVQLRMEAQVVDDDTRAERETSAAEDSCIRSVISPEFSKDQFIRKAWIALAAEDAPIEVFDEDFGEVTVKEHQILVDSIDADVSYQVSIGYDRQEPYIDYETYTEKEPYIAYEKQYNSATKQYEERQVTKYKDVKKQRQVTKYKTVTDWSPMNGTLCVSSTAVVENIQGQYLDKDLFARSFRDIKDSSITSAGSEMAAGLQVTELAWKAIRSDHSNTIDSTVRRSLPGDHYRDLSWNSKTTDASTALYVTPKYEVSISFNGEAYRKYAFPFGAMPIGGLRIENEVSLQAVTEKKQAELDRKSNERREAIDKIVASKTNGISLLTIGLLIASIVVSFCVRSTAIVVGMFAVSVAAFIVNTIKVRKETETETRRANEEIAGVTSMVKAEMADYSKVHKRKVREALDNKLISLGYEPTGSSEL